MVLRRLDESKRLYVRRRSLRRSVYRLMWAVLIVIAAVSVLLFYFGDVVLGKQIFLWTASLVVLYTVFVLLNLGAVKGPDGEPRNSIQPANMVTAVRFFLVPPIVILLSKHYMVWALVLYCIAALTDIIDGWIARRFGQETLLGVMLDPVGDIVTTWAVFLIFLVRGIVPLWLFMLLTIRYTQFFAGVGALAVMGALPRLRATVVGKIVGVVQSLGIIIILSLAIFPGAAHGGPVRIVLHTVLGAAFVSVIVSQTVIGWKVVREGGFTARHNEGGS